MGAPTRSLCSLFKRDDVLKVRPQPDKFTHMALRKDNHIRTHRTRRLVHSFLSCENTSANSMISAALVDTYLDKCVLSFFPRTQTNHMKMPYHAMISIDHPRTPSTFETGYETLCVGRWNKPQVCLMPTEYKSTKYNRGKRCLRTFLNATTN